MIHDIILDSKLPTYFNIRNLIFIRNVINTHIPKYLYDERPFVKFESTMNLISSYISFVFKTVFVYAVKT